VNHVSRAGARPGWIAPLLASRLPWMSRLPRALVLAAGALAAGVLLAPRARAHINLLEPAARVPGLPDSTLVLGPCGQRRNERLEDRVSVFRPGQSIDMVWDVYVQHVSYFRIAFDPDGDDSFSTRPSAPSDAATDDPTQLPAGDGEIILDYILDRTGDVDHVERRVTLPSVECDRCTLQLTQLTYGLPLDEAFYYQCADVVLDDGDGVVELEVAAGSDAAPAGGCSLVAGAASSRSGHAGRWLFLAPLAGAFAARRKPRQRAGRDSIQARSSST
jgi:hypothetical protein